MPGSIIVDNLSKQYRLGETHRCTTLREALTNGLRYVLPGRRPERKSFWALRDVSFKIDEGEVVGLIGRNGAGKSTLLKLISKITYPTQGAVRTQGRIGSLLEVGTGFHGELTGKENIYLNGAILGMRKKEIDAKLDAIIEFSGVEEFIDTPIKRYSSGMRLRLGFAVAAHLDPDILLVDEVLAVGDAEFQKKCLKAMDDLHSGGRTVMFVSHNLSAVENLCRRAVWIDNGRIRLDGPSDQVIREYLGTFAQADQSAYQLRDMERRGVTGAIRCTDLAFLDDNRVVKPVVRSGESLVVRIGYEALQRVRNPHFGFEIHSDTGAKVTSMNTWMSRCDIPTLPLGKGYAELEIDCLHLLPGRYYITLWVMTVEAVSHDRLDHCAVLNVEGADIYESGRAIDRSFGLVYMPCRWNLDGLYAAQAD